MSDFLERVSKLSPKRLALLALELQTRIETLERARGEPIAVVGMSCRFPDAENVDAFWRLLHDGVDAITEVPPERWDAAALYDPDPNAPGKVATRWGGFMRNVDQFEPQLFGISPREAASMDPQQRLLLEVGWEALEDAGYAPDRLNGSATGVFVGLCNNDYAQMQLVQGHDALDMYFATGGAHSVASGRLSYVLGLQGPSLAVDTACSSSLVAIHLAMASLRQGECRMALAGGANLILQAETTVALSRGNMMAPDGRCKTFDAAADGFARSEGCGLIVLKRLADSQADGDRVLAVLRGSAVNQDGRSNGLTAPNGPSQEAVVRQALADAGITPDAVSFVETHGTGTALGDPIEVRALGAVFGTDRPAKLMLGSVKTNIGHAESAAGVAGLIKVILALQHREIPPHLHFNTPSPYIPWDELAVTVPVENTPWESRQGPRTAGVSSFGFSGTNVHIVVQEPPAPIVPASTANNRPAHLLTLSARDDKALRELAGRYAHHLADHPGQALADVAYTANTGRAQWKHRLAVVAREAAQAREALDAFAAGNKAGLHAVAAGERFPGPVMLLTGQGGLTAGMGRALYEGSAVFRAAIERCNAILEPLLGRSLVSLLYPPPGAPAGDASPLSETRYSHPVLFAVQYALAEVWQSWGITPAAVIGHSAGEYVAACVAGVLTLADALTLVAARARLQHALPPDGEMAAVFGDPARVGAALAPWADRVAIAAINGPDNLVISGARDAVAAALEQLNAQGIRGRRLAIPMASHSPLMEPILPEFERVCRTVTYHAPQVDWYSCVTGALAQPDTVDAAYWPAHTRVPVRFADALQAAYAAGHRVFLEIGPAPTLTALGQRCLPADAGVWAASLRPGKDDWEQMLSSLGALYVHGAAVEWATVDRDPARRRVALPTYPFQRTRHWFAAASQPAAASWIPPSGTHPLLGVRLRSPAIDSIVFESRINANHPAFLSHHRVLDQIVMPSPAYIEMILAGAREAFGATTVGIENLSVQEALPLPAEGWVTVQLVMSPPAEGRAECKIVSRAGEGEMWTLHATATVRMDVKDLGVRGARPDPKDLADPSDLAPRVPSDLTALAPSGRVDPAAIRARCGEETSGAAYYERMAHLGLEFGPGFRGIASFVRGDGEALGEIRLPDELASEASRYAVHPALLDACFHLLGAPLPEDGEAATYLLVGLESLRLYRHPGTRVHNHTVLRTRQAGETCSGDIRLFDDEGDLVAEVEGVVLKRATRETLWRRTHRSQVDENLYTVDWPVTPLHMLPAPRDLAAPARARFAVLAEEHGLAAYRTRLGELDGQAIAYVRQAFADLGWQPRLGERVIVADLAAQLHVADQHRRAFGRLLEMLGDAGDLRAVGADGPKARGSDGAEEELTRRCGEQLARVLRGEVDPLALLFPNGSPALTEAIYAASPFARIYNTLLAELTVASLPPARAVRILEIGAGTGATTAALLSRLPAERIEYTFTDVSPAFLARAQEGFATYPFVRYATLDIERDPIEQGQGANEYDIVIAANVLHATADLAQALAHIHRLLAPEGLLVLMEGTQPQPWVDITFGLTAGWWRFADRALRLKHPLLSQARWLELLAANGFVDPTAVPDGGDQVVLIARAAGAMTADTARPWTIVADRGTVGQALVQLLRDRGETCEFVRYDETRAPLEIAAGTPARIVDLRALDQAEPGDMGPAAELASERVVQLVQTLAPVQGSRLWLVTRNAQNVPGTPAPIAIAQAPLWGLGRVLALEHPELWGGLIDLPTGGTPGEDAHRLLAELVHSDGEDQVAYRGNNRHVPRLTPRAPLAASRPQIVADGSRRPKIVADGTYLVTGGLGGLGRQVARWLADQGARHLVLVGRTGLHPAEAMRSVETLHATSLQNATSLLEQNAAEVEERRRAVDALQGRGVEVTVVAADVGDRDEMQALVDRLRTTHPPLRGILHLAAALGNASLEDMTPAALHEMLHPKVAGAWNLHQLSRDLPLDWFVCFSSTTALWGSQTMAHYAAANAFLDQLAPYRAALGLPALTINWGTWQEMRVASDTERERVAQFGLTPLPTARALDILGAAMGQKERPNQLVAAAVDWRLLKPAYEARGRRPFLERVGNAPVVPAPAAHEKQSEKREPDLVLRLAGASPEERRDVIAAEVRQHVAHVLGMSSGSGIDDEQGLFEMGVDSLMSVELKSRLETSAGRTLPSTLTFNYPTVAALTGYLDRLLGGVTPNVSPATVPAEAAVAPAPAMAPSALDDLTEDQLAQKLAARLAQLK